MASEVAPIEGVAIIGLHGRFPGAPDLDQFWRNLRDGVESISVFTDQELLAAGVAPELLDDPRCLRAGGVLEGIDQFDARFFGYSPREAEVMDPQHRLFLEGAWAALEHAGYCSDYFDGSIGVYAGSSLNTYLLNNLVGGRVGRPALEDLTTLLGSDKDFLASRVSYQLDLTGPSVVVQSGCSTSLVAVAQAYLALMGHQCDMALAGGVAVRVPQARAQAHVPEGILSPDGHCRPFDARGRGTCFGSGLGVVVLKRLSDALADGDSIRAVLRGAAVNNDGARKLSFTAPSVDRQAEVIAIAQELACVEARTISFIEAHGTGTELGDPVEVAALTRAFRAGGAGPGTCALGSVKSNLGHLDTASGIAGLLKTVLALEHGLIPPTLHFEQPNAELDLEHSPFFVNRELRAWPTNETPRRAGVSSFGIGGTNAHVVLEQAPEPVASRPASVSRGVELLVLSARTETALQSMSANLAAHLRAHPELALEDVAFTLQVGRKAFEHRRALVCEDREQACQRLELPAGAGTPNRALARAPAQRSLAFCFPDLGAARVGAGRELFESEPSFREHVTRCCELLRPRLGLDLRELLFPAPDQAARASERLREPHLGQPAWFVLELSLARLWMSWGAQPEALFGAGVGEWVAACLSEVFSLEDALSLICARGQSALDRSLDRPLELAAFAREVERVGPRAPQLPWVSGATGTWIAADQARDPGYWAGPSLRPDRLAEGLEVLGSSPGRAFLELGPIQSLSPLISAAIELEPTSAGFCALGEVGHERSEVAQLLDTVGQLWAHGVGLDWRAFQGGQQRRRVHLPTYPFERERCWVEPAASAAREPAPGPDRWLHVPRWQRDPRAPASKALEGRSRWLLLGGGNGLSESLARSLRQRGDPVTRVESAPRFEQLGPDRWGLDPSSRADLQRLVEQLDRAGPALRIVHAWLATADRVELSDALARGFFGLYHLADALSAWAPGVELELTVLTSQAQDVIGDSVAPERATVLGACRVLPQEQPELRVRTIDIELAAAGLSDEQLALLELELVNPRGAEPVVALRRGRRWVQAFAAIDPPEPAAETNLRQRGVYLITGGLGGIGLTLADHLAREVGARLVLCGRSGLPAREEWDEILSAEACPQRTAVESVLALERRGAEVLVLQADVAKREHLTRVVEATRERYGTLNGVIHAAGIPGDNLLRGRADPVSGAALGAKIDGSLALLEACGDEPDFILLCSAVATVIGGLGQADYCAGNAFMDALAVQHQERRSPRILSVGWDTWTDVGMAANARPPAALRARHEQVLAAGLSREQGVEVFRRALASAHPHVLVSKTALGERLLSSGQSPPAPAVPASVEPSAASEAEPGPDSTPTDDRESGDPVEQAVVMLWMQLLGVAAPEPEDSFFEQGGNSLLATQMLARLHERFERAEVSLRSFFARPTIAGLVQEIRASEDFTAEVEPPQPSLREQLLGAAPDRRSELLAVYLEQQVAQALDLSVDALPADRSWAGLDETLLAAHLTTALKRDLDLHVYPHEIRAHRCVPTLARWVVDELERLESSGARNGAAEPAASPQLQPARASGMAAEDAAGKNESMAFVLSPPRSGSTLLRLMLSAHSALFCPPELFLLDNEGLRAWSDDPFAEFYRDGLVRAFMASRNTDFETARAVVDGLVARDASVREVYGMLQSEAAGMLVDKTPTYALNATSLQRAEQLFDRPKYIFLVRHPYSVIDSFVRNRIDRIRRVEGDSFALAEEYWTRAHSNLARFADELDPERVHRLRFEELVRNPAACLRDLCAFLGVEFEPAVLDPYGRGSMFAGPGDPNLFQRGAIDATLGDAWKQIELPRPLGSECAQLARSLGYELPD